MECSAVCVVFLAATVTMLGWLITHYLNRWGKRRDRFEEVARQVRIGLIRERERHDGRYHGTREFIAAPANDDLSLLVGGQAWWRRGTFRRAVENYQRLHDLQLQPIGKDPTYGSAVYRDPGALLTAIDRLLALTKAP